MISYDQARAVLSDLLKKSRLAGRVPVALKIGEDFRDYLQLGDAVSGYLISFPWSSMKCEGVAVVTAADVPDMTNSQAANLLKLAGPFDLGGITADDDDGDDEEEPVFPGAIYLTEENALETLKAHTRTVIERAESIGEETGKKVLKAIQDFLALIQCQDLMEVAEHPLRAIQYLHQLAMISAKYVD